MALALGSVLMLALVLTLIVVRPQFGRGEQLAGLIVLGGSFPFVWSWVRTPLAFCLLVVWVTTIYHVAPSRHTSWLRELPGGVFAAALLLASWYGFGSYLRLAASANRILGVLSSSGSAR